MNNVNCEGVAFTPTKVICIGRNYVEHIHELNNEIPQEPVIFLKPNSSVCEELIAPLNEPCHYEGEISFLIKDNRYYAVGVGLDLTFREIQSRLKEKGLPWERAKAFDKSAVFSSFLPIQESEIKDLSMKLYINNEPRQEARYDLMMYKPQNLLEEIETIATLEGGDIVMTGTPKGVGELIRGDLFRGEIYLKDKMILSKEWEAK